MTLNIVITGQIRGGKNNICITRTGRRFPNKQWAAWRAQKVKEVIAQILLTSELYAPVNVPFNTPCSVKLAYYAGDKRRRDFTAVCDSVWHVLEKAGVVTDDTLLWPVESSRGYDKENPRYEITIQPEET